MTKYTENYGLAKPDYSDPVDVGNDIVANFEKIDKYASAPLGVPADFIEAPKGQLLWDEFSGHLKLKTDTETISIGTTNKARGRVAYEVFAHNSATIADGDESEPGVEITFNAEAGRRYLVYTFLCIQWESGGPLFGAAICNVKYRWVAGPGPVTTTDTEIGSVQNVIAGVRGGDRGFTRYIEFFPNVTGQVTIGVTFENGGPDPATVIRLFSAFSGRNSIMWAKDYG